MQSIIFICQPEVFPPCLSCIHANKLELSDLGLQNAQRCDSCILSLASTFFDMQKNAQVSLAEMRMTNLASFAVK